LNIESFLQEDSNTKTTGNKFENCVSFIEEHGLYQLGLELFKNDTNQRRMIFVSLCEHLLKERRSEAALSVFLAADPPCLEGAKRAARAAGDLRCYFALLDDEHAGEMTNVHNN
jgi:hypothetical protein